MHDYAYLVQAHHNAQIDVVAGYKGTLDITLAMERGEVDGACGWDWSSAKSQKPDWLRDGKLNILPQLGPNENAELTTKGAPQVWNYMKDDDTRRVHEMVVSQQAFTRPYFVASGTPAELVAHPAHGLRRHHARPQFLADAEKMRIDVSPLPGATVQELVRSSTPRRRQIVEQAPAARSGRSSPAST